MNGRQVDEPECGRRGSTVGGWRYRFILVSVLVVWVAGWPATAAEPSIPTAPYPVERYVVFDAGFDTLWRAVDGVVSVSGRRLLLRAPAIGLFTYAEFLAPKLQEGSFRNLPFFLARLRQPDDDLSARLAPRLSAAVREALAAYDPRTYPREPMVQLVLTDLNRLLFEETIDGVVSPPDRQRPAAGADGHERAVWNRLVLEAAYPNQILHSAYLDRPRSEATLVVTVYLHPVSATRTALFASGWLEGSSIVGEQQRELFADVEAVLRKPGGSP